MPTAAADVTSLHRSLLRAVESLSSASTLDALLDTFLKNALTVTGAAAGAIMDRTGRIEFSVRSLKSNDGAFADRAEYATDSAFRKAAARDDLGILRRTADGDSFCYTAAESMAQWFPEAWAFHSRRGHHWICHYPFRVEGRVSGYLLLAWLSEPPELESETIRSLADHASWALEALRLGRRDTEEALRRRADELARANAALRRSSDRMCSLEKLGSFLDDVLASCVDISGAEGGVVAIRNPSGELQQVSEIGSPRSCLGSLSIDDWSPLAGAPGFCRNYAASAEFRMRAAIQGRGRKLGYIGLVFPSEQRPSEVTLELIRVLANQAGLAIQMSALARDAEQTAISREQERAARQRAIELEEANAAIARITRGLTSLDQLRPFLEGLLAECLKASGAVSGAIIAGGDGAEQPRSLACLLRGKSYEGPLPRFILWDRLQEQKRVVWADSTDAGTSDHDTYEFHANYNHGQVAAIPMLHDSRTIGYLALAFDREHQDPRNSANIELCQTLAQHATLAIGVRELADQARDTALAQERQRSAEARAAELSEAAAALRRTGSHLTQGLNLTAFVQQVRHEATTQTKALDAELYAWNPDEDSITAIDGSQERNETCPVPAEWKQNWAKLLTGEPVISRCDDGDQEQYALAIPVLLGTQLLGFLCLSFPQVCPGGCKLELLQSLAQQTAVAMQLRELAERSLQSAVLEERANLARELHDTLLQGFTGVTLQLRALVRRLPSATAEVQERLARIESEATEAVQGARRAVGDMRGGSPVLVPVASEDLVSGLADLIRSSNRVADVNLVWQVTGKVRELPAAVCIALLRIAREAISNAIRHASPDTVSVLLRYEHNQVELRVEDTGSGFVVAEKAMNHDGHFGLLGMRERAERVGGNFQIQSQPSMGTIVSVKVPS